MRFPPKPAAALSLAFVLAACGAPVQPASATASVRKGDLVQTVTASGTTVAASQAKLSFKVPGKLARLAVSAGDLVSDGQVLAELDPTDLQVALQQAQAGRQAAEAAIAGAQAKVQQLIASAKPETIAQANAAADATRQKLQQVEKGARPEQVQQAQAAVQAAEAKLRALKDGPRPEQVAVFQRQIDVAKNNLYAMQITRDALCAGVKFGQTAPTGAPVTCEGGQAAVNAAQTALDQANQQFRLQTAPPTATDLQQAQAAVDQVKAQLALLQNSSPQDVQAARDAVAQADAAAQLAARPYTNADLAAAQAGVQQAEAQLAQAQAAVDAAQANLQSAQLKAPATGKVLQINSSAGEVMSSLGVPTVVMVLGLGEVVVNASLPETALAQVKPGQDAGLTFDSLPGKVLSGKVADVSPAASTVQNLVSYVATIKLQNQGDQVRPGMNAAVTIHTLRKQDALLVPNGAVQSYQGKDIVMVISGGEKKPTDVQVGASDAQNTEIVTGLTEGQQVALIAKPLNGIGVGENKPA